jgi:hypothetical protein
MYSALLILVLLALVASLGSWLFNQWSNEQRRASALAMGLGGMGLVLSPTSVQSISGPPLNVSSRWRATGSVEL